MHFIFLPFSATLSTEIIPVLSDLDPCDHHRVLDDFRRSPLYQPQTPRDVLCDRQLSVGWYRFTIQNRSAEMPTRCASVNYCGTQAPLWLRLDDGQRLPDTFQQTQLTACSSWSRHHYDDEDDSVPVTEYDDCCAMKYPVSVRNCSSYFVYRLQPTEACNMAYCAQLPSTSGDDVFTFDRPPEIHADADYLNCSIAINSSHHGVKKFRFHWIVLSGTGQQTTAQTSAEKPEHYDLLPRHKITAGNKVMCQVEVIVDDEPDSPMTLMSNPSVTSSVFTAGIVISPGVDDVTKVYKNGSFVNVTLTATVPFTCAAHINQHDCHLTVQVVQPDDGLSQPLAISQCQLSLDSETTSSPVQQHFLVVPVTDFVRTNSRKRPVVLQLVVSSYGDAWWHGYQLPNITFQVLDVPPIQCYAFTQGHVISVADSLDKVDQAGRHLLYSNRQQSFEVWTEYQPCYSGRKDALCICSAEVRSSSGDETFLMDRCQPLHSRRTTNSPYQILGGRRPLPKMSLTGKVPNGRKQFKVLESRQGKLITVVLEHGGKVRIRTEEWGMSVSVVDAGPEPEELTETIGGLCNPDNNIRLADSMKTKQKQSQVLFSEEFCACRPSQDAYLSNAIVTNHLKCDPALEDCPPVCQQPQSVVEWTTFFNYLDISDQVRMDIDDDIINSFNLIDTPQRDSASVEENDARIQQHPPAVDHNWSSFKSSSSGTNLGRDIHWTVANSRNRRDTPGKMDGGGSSHQTWNDEEEVTLYCSNFLVNSTVALECGQYLVGNFIMKAIQICVEDVSRNEDPAWAQESLGLLEDQCEVEATYRRASDWPRNILGRPVIPPIIIEALNCPNRCSHQGVCLPYGCVCQPGFYGSDCSLMDDTPPRIEKVGDGDGLCDLRASDCRKIEIVGSGFIDSSRLNCQIHPGRYDGSSWQRGSYNNRSIPSSAQFIDQERIICHLLVTGSNRRHVLDDVSEELHLEIRVTNDGIRYSVPTSRLTIYHSGCRSCPAKKDSWPLCGDREDVCYLDNSCYPDGEVNPHNPCQSCSLDHPQSWSLNPNNLPPVVSNRLKTTAYDGQVLEYFIHAVDQDPLHFGLVDPLSDAQVTPEGIFRWKAVSNALSPFNHENFALTVSDQCNHPVHFHLHVDVLPCPCLNGGTCRNPPDDFITSNQIDPTYRCHCREGFTGPDCGIRIDFCDPNPCRDGLCLNEVDGYVCDCFLGFKGIHCDQKDESLIENALSPIMITKHNDTFSKQDGCTVPCQNGGTCMRRNRCQCPEGFVGRQCQWTAPTCHPSCLNGGHCSRRKVCACKKGWTGSRCETAICGQPCLNGGVCSAPGKCTCPDEYHGSRCQKAICKPKCRRGGKCIGPGICLCRAGFGGSNCELRLSSAGKRNWKKANSVGKAKAIFLET
ncbi:von Willebrand factor D and EGF domain-containing protein isoform X2 [Daphnia magna]|uniref:von Willebrand factor D and EGF domain-containing protein isoform X2 n=1 Tax=Daphnia magna TaxID=35525 RepID=UPI001E1BAEB0|nr:von Willebrand factor D and EGF domain-containing protein isoform X2 [Daphnia magna]